MMIPKMNAGRVALALVMVGSFAGCSHFGNGQKAGAASGSNAVVSETISKDDYEAKLRALVADYVKSASKDEGRGTVIRRKPYYFKQYSVYPDGTEGMQVDIQEKDSRTTPYIAKVKLAMQRFATRMHRKRDEAQADNNFLRDTGAETLTFEVRGGRWWRAGSLFVADKTEENINGEWVPAKEEVERTVSQEEKQGSWFNRAWSSITGR